MSRSRLAMARWDEEYWRDEDAEEMNVRQKARRLGIPKEKVDEMMRRKGDAFAIGNDEWEEMKDE